MNLRLCVLEVLPVPYVLGSVAKLAPRLYEKREEEYRVEGVKDRR